MPGPHLGSNKSESLEQSQASMFLKASKWFSWAEWQSTELHHLHLVIIQLWCEFFLVSCIQNMMMEHVKLLSLLMNYSCFSDITLPNKVRIVKAMVFLVVMCGCESWTIKKAEYWRIDAFELWYWRRLLRVPWNARRSNQSILKEISVGRTDAEAGAPILWPPDVKNWLIGKDPDAGEDWRQEEKGLTEDKIVR